MKALAIAAFLLSASSCVVAQGTCAYLAKESPDNQHPEWQLYHDCAKYEQGILTIAPEHMDLVSFGLTDMAPFWMQGQFFYIKSDGAHIPVIRHDNGADYFSEGLVRSVVNGKIAYYNTAFEMVVPPKYDWGWPFSGGRALVCLGCSSEAPDMDGHRRITGGLWGYIDNKGTEVVPVKYSQTEVGSK